MNARRTPPTKSTPNASLPPPTAPPPFSFSFGKPKAAAAAPAKKVAPKVAKKAAKKAAPKKAAKKAAKKAKKVVKRGQPAPAETSDLFVHSGSSFMYKSEDYLFTTSSLQ
mmetsp:Transcript_55983/g.148704  ORF Transcript_55983/g.148704 Transcript_55983/m.148704 type:complete len:110 (-) Transcript_55983:150-479(-)